MREKLEALSVAVLRDLAESQNVKGYKTMRKSQLVDALLAVHEAMEQAKAEAESQTKAASQTDAESQAKAADQPAATAPAATAPATTAPTEAAPVRKRRGRPPKNAATQTATPATAPAETDTTISQDGNATDQQPIRRRKPVIRRTHPRFEGQDSDRQTSDRQTSDRQTLARPESTKPADEMNRQPVQEAAQESVRQATQEPVRQAAQDSVSSSDDLAALEISNSSLTNEPLSSQGRAHGILEIMPEGYGFIRCENFLPGENDVYVAHTQIRRFNLRTGDFITGNTRRTEKYAALSYITAVNGFSPEAARTRTAFEDLTPIFPNERLRLEIPGERNQVATRIVDLISPIGKGQRGMIVSPPKAGKTTLLKQVARAIKTSYPDMHMIVLLIDERPEEVTDIRECIEGDNAEVIYSTFDELPDHHKRVSEMVLERAKRLVEHGKDVIILLDSITRLARAYNLTCVSSGRTLSGGLDPAALHMPKKFFGAARNMREGGSLTILATALVDTGSRMDDVVFEEFKGTGNMELVLDRSLSEKRIFPAIDILKSGTRREDLLLTPEEMDAVNRIRRVTGGAKGEDALEKILELFAHSRTNAEFMLMLRKVFVPVNR